LQGGKEQVFKSIVVGTDGSDTAKEAVAKAAELARATGARLHILCAARIPSPALLAADPAGMASAWTGQSGAAIEAEVKEILEAAAGCCAGVPVETHPSFDDPAEALISLAEQLKADLIVVGNRGMTGRGRFLLGTVPNRISHHCPCSLLIVKTT